jgi:uncharacterized membrane protein
MTHPLKIVCLGSLSGLLATQISLLVLPVSGFAWYWVLLLILPLLLPLPGFIKDRLYTYKWAGFLTLFYFCLGISELVSNPDLKIYAYLTTVLSTTLFISDIYYTRFLRLTQKRVST